MQILWDRIKLWNGVCAKPFHIFFHLWHDRVGLFTSVSFKKSLELWVHISPYTQLILIVINSRNKFISYFVFESNVRNSLSTFAVLWIGKTRMVNFFNTVPRRKYLLAQIIEILYLCREPRYLNWSHLSDVICDNLKLSDSLLDIGIIEGAIDVYIEIGFPPVIMHKLWWLRVDSRQVNLICGQNIQSFVKDSMRFCHSEW